MKQEDFNVRGTNRPRVEKIEAVKPELLGLVDRVKLSLKGLLKTVVWTAGTLAVESAVVWLCWNYIGGNCKYSEAFVGLLMVRLIFRGTVFDKELSNNGTKNK
jgi:hypothetical protein